ncbi:helix-turn-helix transcriptional regulator [Tistrella bauzanensis]|uniref:Helix-turn-helix transcriptional regulator n=1 Tax=Tistrella arctica TaxID=3133430 RepID=A0ABU9YEJ2_9PROT
MQAREPLESAALAGALTVAHPRPGLMVHTTDGIECDDRVHDREIAPSITAVIVLDGLVEASFGGRRQICRAGPAGAAAFAVSLAEPDRLLRQFHAGAHVRKLTLRLDRGWLEAAGLAAETPAGRFCGRHLAAVRWTPSPRLVALTAGLITAEPPGDPFSHLIAEARSLETAAAVLAAVASQGGAVGGDVPAPGGLRPADLRRATRLRERLETLCDALERDGIAPSLTAVAADCGVSVSTMQRLFRAAHGQSIAGWLRGRRLDHARAAIASGHSSIAEAAFHAGYGDVGNFTTAFRRRFGTTPGRVARGG